MKAALFDVDGTIVDSVDLHARAWQDAFREFGHDFRFEEVRSQIGKGGDQLMPVFLSRQELKEKGKQIEEFRSQHFRQHYLSQVKSFPEVRPLFQRLLNDGWKIALASSAKGKELEIYKKLAEVSDLLDTETSSEDAEKSKPHPDIFLAAIDRLQGAKPQDCIVVGDTPYDATAGLKAGVGAVVGMLCGGFAEADLRAAGCAEIYRDPADLLAHLANSIFCR